jgi:hypothetical protein
MGTDRKPKPLRVETTVIRIRMRPRPVELFGRPNNLPRLLARRAGGVKNF